ncbi:MAG: M23 family metallopeptidase [Anaerolineae bacterium]|nr:M23 family metallopeptidase [Anaerolineae bacterium]
MSDELEHLEQESADHLADTNPMRPVVVERLPAWRRLVGLFSLLAAVGLTLATIGLLFVPPGDDASGVIETSATSAPPTVLPPTPEPVAVENTPEQSAQTVAAPVISPELGAALLSQPLQFVSLDSGFAVTRNEFKPFTFVPDRPRSEIIEYEVVSGDTMFSIAERFGIKPESIGWSNPRSIIGNLRPGMVLTIPPVDGAVELIANDRTIANLATGYGVDPYAIIDWESNGLYGASPDTMLLSGMRIFVPGGTAEQISWTPRVERTSGNSGGVGTISFAPGEPGSCGQVANPGGFGNWQRPLGSYTFVQGFSAWHSGVDLAAPVGTPVYAALGGVVIFRGWNSFGYGYLVVLAHGPFTTVYGHLSDFNVACGQSVSPGQVIAFSGNSGNSSGPHLHFEIRYNDIVQDPTTIMAF